MATPFAPDLAEIAAASAAIRRGWDPAEHEDREEQAVDMQVRLMAGILKPMAVEAGLLPADEQERD